MITKQTSIRSRQPKRIQKKIRARYFVYIVQCCDRTFYVGYTNNVEKRLLDHNTSKRAARYTRGRRPVILRYVETLSTLSLALQREAEIKCWTRAKKLELINQ